MSGSRIFVRSGDSYYRSSPKKNSKKTKSHSSPVKHKESWNIYLSDNDRYKLSDEEMNRRKESIAYSPNNILYSPSKVTPSPSKGFIKNVNLNKKGFTFASPKKLASQFDLVSPRVTVKPVTQHMSLLKNSLINSRLPINIENDVDDDEDDDLFHLNFDSTSQSPSQDDFKKSKTKSKMTTKKPIKSTNSHKYEKIADEMMFQEVASQVESLLGEIRHYEQLSGRRSCFDAEELETIFANQLSSAKGSTRTVVVLKFLTQLVSQTMSYLLQSQIQIQRQNALNTSLSAQIAQNSSVAERSDNAAETVPAETIDFVSTSLPTPVSQSSNEVAEDHKVSTGSICPSTDIESPQNHADSISQHSKFSTKLPANLIKTSTWTAETARRSRSPARMPNGTSASDWLFAHPASGTSVALLSSLIAPKSAQSKSNPQYPNHSDILKPAVTATMHAPSQSRQDVQAPQLVIPPATSMPERGSRGRNAIDEQFIAVDRFTPLTSSIASKATHRSKADKTNDATYDAFYNLTQLKPSTKGSPLTLKESPAQETPSMLFPRTNAPTPYAPTQLTDCNVPRAGAGPANSYLSPRISPQEVHTRLFYSADS